MNFLLHNLNTKQEVDDVIRTAEDKVLVLRFGKGNQTDCLVLDDVLSKSSPLLGKMAVIYTVEVDSVPVYVQYFDITIHPATVFFFNGQHIKVDYGTPDHTKFIGTFRSKQDFMDLVEVIFRGAMRGKLIVKSPVDLNRMDKYDLLYGDV